VNRAACLSALLGIVVLAGCGLREPLEPAPGQRAAVVPATANRAPTTEEMLTAPPIARPGRVGEVTRSEERRESRFDLPPADVPAGSDPVTGDPPAEEQPE
jgi:multidrug efflux pump subunit AcrA (membrane-fusion protein)